MAVLVQTITFLFDIGAIAFECRNNRRSLMCLMLYTGLKSIYRDDPTTLATAEALLFRAKKGCDTPIYNTSLNNRGVQFYKKTLNFNGATKSNQGQRIKEIEDACSGSVHALSELLVEYNFEQRTQEMAKLEALNKADPRLPPDLLTTIANYNGHCPPKETLLLHKHLKPKVEAAGRSDKRKVEENAGEIPEHQTDRKRKRDYAHERREAQREEQREAAGTPVVP